MTADAPVADLAAANGALLHRGIVWRALTGAREKDPHRPEQTRKAVAGPRRTRIVKRQRFMSDHPGRMDFVAAASCKTDMAETTSMAGEGGPIKPYHIDFYARLSTFLATAFHLPS